MNDTTSFALAFASIALILAGYMHHLERRARRLEEQLATLQATSANPKNRSAPASPKT